jgi:chaperonin GroEL
VAQIHLGPSTKGELKERKQRVRCALNATRSAVEEGILPGGGVALVQAAKALASVRTVSNDEKTGVDIIRRALEAPIKQIAANSGVEGDTVVAKVLEAKDANFGFNARTLKYGDMLKFGVIDSTKVVRSALRNAAGVAALLLSSGALISGGPVMDAAPGPVEDSLGMSVQ